MKTLSTASQISSIINSGRRIIIKFYAKWCGACLSIKKEYQGLSDKYKNVEFYEVDVDTIKKIGSVFNIENIPDIRYYSGGKMKARILGTNLGSIEHHLK
uniref:Thioredoxin n=1 Tax=Pithovirus LCPAC001 TaxID=2506585 RepID=A0A481Z2Q7_9VIRU|nr:MAG: thioredoxin [Pithovirus LCPAC001]